MRKFLLLMSAVLAGLDAVPAHGQSDSMPLLRSHCTIAYTIELIPPTQSFVEERDLGVAQSGEAVRFWTIQANGGSFTSVLVRSAGGGAELQNLRAALVRARAGFQTSCSIFDDASTGRCELTWYGRNGRRNSFVVERGPASPFPPCPPAVDELSGAIVQYEAFVLNHPS